MTVECPIDGRKFDTGFALAVHWGSSHEGPTPDGIDTSRSDETRETLSDANLDNPKVIDAVTEAWKDPEFREKQRKSRIGKKHSDERRKNVSESVSEKWEDEDYRRRVSEGVSEANTDNERLKQAVSEALTDNQNVIEARKEQWTREEYRKKVRGGQVRSKGLCNIDTIRNFRSKSESIIDLILFDHGIDYEHQPGPYDIGDRTYTPDFKIDKQIVEVKGWPIGDSDIRAEKFMKTYPEHTYIVVGEAIPCDIHIEWNNRETLPEVLA